MKATTLDLRYKMKDILRAIDRGETVTVLYRGKEKAQLVPIQTKPAKKLKASDHPAFGMWKDREDTVDSVEYINRLRRELHG